MAMTTGFSYIGYEGISAVDSITPSEHINAGGKCWVSPSSAGPSCSNPNSTVVSYIIRRGQHTPSHFYKCLTLLTLSSLHLLSVKATHIPGCLNLGADLLSTRRPLVREWRLYPQVVTQTWDQFGGANIDPFA